MFRMNGRHAGDANDGDHDLSLDDDYHGVYNARFTRIEGGYDPVLARLNDGGMPVSC